LPLIQVGYAGSIEENAIFILDFLSKTTTQTNLQKMKVNLCILTLICKT
jgi:hypothetical protein